CAAGRLHPADVRAWLGGMADDDGKTYRRRKGGERLPVDIFGQDRLEDRLVRLMRADHVGPLCGCFSTLPATGILRRRLPVAAWMALATAGTIADVPISPIPPGGSVLLTM